MNYCACARVFSFYPCCVLPLVSGIGEIIICFLQTVLHLQTSQIPIFKIFIHRARNGQRNSMRDGVKRPTTKGTRRTNRRGAFWPWNAQNGHELRKWAYIGDHSKLMSERTFFEGGVLRFWKTWRTLIAPSSGPGFENRIFSFVGLILPITTHIPRFSKVSHTGTQLKTLERWKSVILHFSEHILPYRILKAADIN